MSQSRPRVAIVHPWMPQYRVELFERLRTSLDAQGVSLDVAYGTNPPFARDRGDDRELSWGTRLSERDVSLGGRSLVRRELWTPALTDELLIMEDALRNTDTFRYLLSRRRRHMPTAFWGPGKTMDKAVGRVERFAKRALLKQADWWFSYTEDTANQLAALGLPAERITALGNTLDTTKLSQARRSVTLEEVAARQAQLGLTPGHTGLFMGGLGPTKKLDLLVAAGRRVHAADPSFRIVVVGDGPERELVSQVASEESFLIMLGPLFEAREKALVAAASDLLLIPGLVGLVAIDSFALGLPIATAVPGPHGPEFSYLRAGENAVVASATVNDYADTIEQTLSDTVQLERLRAQCLMDAERYSLDSMVDRFSEGVKGALGLNS